MSRNDKTEELQEVIAEANEPIKEALKVQDEDEVKSQSPVPKSACSSISSSFTSLNSSSETSVSKRESGSKDESETIENAVNETIDLACDPEEKSSTEEEKICDETKAEAAKVEEKAEAPERKANGADKFDQDDATLTEAGEIMNPEGQSAQEEEKSQKVLGKEVLPPQVPEQSKMSSKSSGGKKRNRKRQNKSARKGDDSGFQTPTISEEFKEPEAVVKAAEVSDYFLEAPVQPNPEGEWETKKRKSRKSRRNHVQVEAPFEEPEEEIVPVEEPAPEPQVEPVAAPAEEEAKPEEAPVVQVEEEEEVVEEAPKKSSKKRRKRYSSQETRDAKPSTKQILITDGLIDFGQPSGPSMASLANSSGRRRSESQILEEIEKARKNRMEKLFISSIGHGIQDGPLFSGRLGQGRYNPPDRSDEIPLKFRQPEEEEAADDDENGEVSEAKVEEGVKTDLDLD